jgi:excisionase family DNA binding protein
MDINQPLTLTVEQTAKLLGIGRSTAYELVRTGDIPSLRLGRRIVVPVGQIAERLGLPSDESRRLVRPGREMVAARPEPSRYAPSTSTTRPTQRRVW